jgi:hypothetical protein
LRKLVNEYGNKDSNLRITSWKTTKTTEEFIFSTFSTAP